MGALLKRRVETAYYEEGEYLVMQHLMENPVEWEKIVTAGEFTDVVNVVNYVRVHKNELDK